MSKLEDGTYATTRETYPMYRDSLGRRRLDTFVFEGQYSTEGLRIACVRDWVGEYEYILDPANRVAYRMKMPLSIGNPAFPTRMDHVPVPGPPNLVESLGTQIIDGFEAEGRRITSYDAPRPSINEFWVNKELEFVIRAANRPAVGPEIVESFDNVSHSEPDPALFQVPPDYRVVDESGPFTITVGSN